jgi:hypothetical protein
MNRKTLICVLIALSVGGKVNIAAGHQLIVDLSPEDIQEALRLAADENAARKRLQSYIVQTRGGMGTGPLIGYFSTAFSRVVSAAVAAHKERRSFALSDVTPDLLTPQLHVVVLPQSAAYESVPATVQAIGIAPRGSTLPLQTIQPVSIGPATAQHVRLYGIAAPNNVLVAIFPLTAVSAGHDIRVSFSHVVSGSSALTNCKDCVIPLDVARIR